MVLSISLSHLILTVTLRGGVIVIPILQFNRLRLRELNRLSQGYPTCKWQSQTTHLALSAFQILFNTSHCVSKKRRVFQSPLTWTRLGCLLYFPPPAPSWQGTPSLSPSSWLGAGWLAGIRVWTAYQAATLTLLSMHMIGNCAKLQRGHHRRGRGCWICQQLPSAPRMWQCQHQPVV